ncbi:MAG: amino acid ABC transporter substrate-binding protein [Sphaerochaeta sp.]|jgi:polar amino acid transport system substrate-binding protein|uniref:amino acid ABC transporter substrate-binding protein n=1 Tax=Sphaerochaeta sp. TaxID=1972642 RepID=UPI002FCC0194
MKRCTVLLSALLLVASALFAQGTKEQASGVDNSLQKILDKGQLVMGLDDTFPPMGFRDEKGEIVGFDVDLAKEVAKRMGVKLKLQPIDWNAKEQELNTGNIDCIWNGFTITEERKQAMTFTPAYLRNAQVVVVRQDSAFTDLASLAGKTVGYQAGSSALSAIEATPSFQKSVKEFVEFKENLTGLMDLEIGGIDALVVDLMVANDNINRSGKAFRILSEELAPEDYGIGFRKGDQKLADAVWQQLLAMKADGTLAQISTKWFAADITVVGK